MKIHPEVKLKWIEIPARLHRNWSYRLWGVCSLTGGALMFERRFFVISSPLMLRVPRSDRQWQWILRRKQKLVVSNHILNHNICYGDMQATMKLCMWNDCEMRRFPMLLTISKNTSILHDSDASRSHLTCKSICCIIIVLIFYLMGAALTCEWWFLGLSYYHYWYRDLRLKDVIFSESNHIRSGTLVVTINMEAATDM